MSQSTAKEFWIDVSLGLLGFAAGFWIVVVLIEYGNGLLLILSLLGR